MYQKPRAAKRLYFDVIPRAVDDYLTFLDKFPGRTPAQRLENPVWHIHDGQPPVERAARLSFGILLNLASVATCRGQGRALGLHLAAMRRMPRRKPRRSSTGWWAMRWPTTGIS